MFDLTWERSIPIFNIKKDKIESIFNEYDANIQIKDYYTIELGCRNSNFIICTDQGKYLLRIISSNELNNEAVSFNILKGKINIPKLLFCTTDFDENILIYEYIEATSLQKRIIDTNRCDKEIIVQVAKTAAIIHNMNKVEMTGLIELDVPPFDTWYTLFLENPIIKNRIGNEFKRRLQSLISDKQKFINEIDKYYSFIHSDFRPANMLIDNDNTLYVVDWEYACFGHTLADIGQFFRYRNIFEQPDIILFEEIYNEFANIKLPYNWFELSIFRDLINPLQMLTSKDELPMKYSDLKSIIHSTLEFFGY